MIVKCVLVNLYPTLLINILFFSINIMYYKYIMKVMKNNSLIYEDMLKLDDIPKKDNKNNISKYISLGILSTILIGITSYVLFQKNKDKKNK